MVIATHENICISGYSRFQKLVVFGIVCNRKDLLFGRYEGAFTI
jgi:hypothetical protein